MMIEQIKNWKMDIVKDTEIMIYLQKLHELLCNRINFFEKFDKDYFLKHTQEELYRDNHSFFWELNEGYDISYANPLYTKQKLPIAYADIASAYYYEAIMSITLIFQKKMNEFYAVLEKFLVLSKSLQFNQDIYQNMQEMAKRNLYFDQLNEFTDTYDPNNFMTNLVKSEDLDDIRYVYRYGIYISETELAFAKLVQGYSEEELQKLADQMVNGYLKGFQRHNKNMNGRLNSRIVTIVGLEKISKRIIYRLKEYGYAGFIGQLNYKNVNGQAISDFEKTSQLFFDKTDYEEILFSYKKLLMEKEYLLKSYQGNVIMVSFGQKKNEIMQYHPYKEQDYTIVKEYELKKRTVFEQYVPKSQISYTGMAFPVNEIVASNYDSIFYDIMKINQMDPTEHEKMQDKLIEILDQGIYVSLKGFRGNETNIKVYLNQLQDPTTQTNFVNCGADVNIPVGEVYTSPQLNHTTGVIHLQRIRISRVQFKDVRIEVKDGFTTSYSCQNTENELENHELMEEVIFHHREQLPLGEFALGTNTYAYALAKKDGILHLLHTLIYEKLGPHIALGDTCFAWAEDTPLYSFDHKLMCAKDNEYSIQRKEDPSKAYVNLHYDLTIPYDEIGEISVHTRDDKDIIIVKEGLFVIPQLEALNQYLK